MKVEILDGIMGSGKSTSICKWMDDLHQTNNQERFFYISPLLSEVQEDGGRIHKQCMHVKFVSPESKGRSSKSEHLLDLLRDGVNIACTHNLYLNMNGRHFTLMKDLGYTLKLSEAAKDYIAEKGFDKQFGARPLKRAIQKYVEDALAEEIITQKIHEGDQIFMDLDETAQELKIEIKKLEEPSS